MVRNSSARVVSARRSSARFGSSILAANMARSRSRAKSTYPKVSLQISLKTIFKKNFEKNNKRGCAVSGTQNGTVPEQGEIHLPYSLFANFIENDFSKKHRKITIALCRLIRGAKLGRSQRRPKSTYPIVSLKILKTFWPPKLRAGPSSPPSLADRTALARRIVRG